MKRGSEVVKLFYNKNANKSKTMLSFLSPLQLNNINANTNTKMNFSTTLQPFFPHYTPKSNFRAITLNSHIKKPYSLYIPIFSNTNRFYSTENREILKQMKDLNIQGQEYTKLGLHREAINSYKTAINILKQKYVKKPQKNKYNLMEDDEEENDENNFGNENNLFNYNNKKNNNNNNNVNEENVNENLQTNLYTKFSTLRDELSSLPSSESKFAINQAEKSAFFDSREDEKEINQSTRKIAKREEDIKNDRSQYLNKINQLSSNNLENKINKGEEGEINKGEEEENFAEEFNELMGENEHGEEDEEMEDTDEDSEFFVREISFEEVLQSELLADDDLKLLLSRTNFSDPNFAVLFW